MSFTSSRADKSTAAVECEMSQSGGRAAWDALSGKDQQDLLDFFAQRGAAADGLAEGSVPQGGHSRAGHHPEGANERALFEFFARRRNSGSIRADTRDTATDRAARDVNRCDLNPTHTQRRSEGARSDHSSVMSLTSEQPRSSRQELHSPRTNTAANWLSNMAQTQGLARTLPHQPPDGDVAHIPVGTAPAVKGAVQAPLLDREANSRPPQAPIGHKAGAPSSHGPVPLAAGPRKRLQALSHSITECLDLIETAQSDVGDPREQSEIMRRIAQLEAEIRGSQCAPQETLTKEPLASHGDDALPPTYQFEQLLRSSYDVNPVTKIRHAHSAAGGAPSEIIHKSVSMAHQPIKAPHKQPQLSLQQMVNQAVRECMRQQSPEGQAQPTRENQFIPHRHNSQFERREDTRVTPERASAQKDTPHEHRGPSMTGTQASWLNRELRLPKFKGDEDENPLDFLNKFERFAAALSHLSLDQACRQCMPMALTEEAEQWLITESRRWPLDYSYKEFSRALIDRFLPHDYVDRMRRFLETRMQGENETLARFITVIETAYGRTGIVASEREVIRRISSQLNPTYNQLIGHRYFGSIAELSQHARAIDAQVHRQKSFKQVEADCPDADLKVKGLRPPQPTSAAVPVQQSSRRSSQKFGKASSSGESPIAGNVELKDGTTTAVVATTDGANTGSTGEEAPQVRLCYSCGDPSHLAHRCPLRSESQKGSGNKRGSKNGESPSSRQ